MYLQISFDNNYHTCRPAGAFGQQEAIYPTNISPTGLKSAFLLSAAFGRKLSFCSSDYAKGKNQFVIE